MLVNHKTFNRLAIGLGVLAFLLLPFWPYSRWGYFPAGVLVSCVLLMFALKALARE